MTTPMAPQDGSGEPVRGRTRRWKPSLAVLIAVLVVAVLASGAGLFGWLPSRAGDPAATPDAGEPVALEPGHGSGEPGHRRAPATPFIQLAGALGGEDGPADGPLPSAPPGAPEGPAASLFAIGPAEVVVPVLTYHRIDPAGPVDEYVIRPELFDAHLRALSTRGWHAMTARDLGMLLAVRGTPPDKTFVITIDDGFGDGLSYALPVLRRYGFVATFYVIAGLVSQDSRYLTWDGVRALRDAGMEIGNHTVDHPHLNKLTADQAAAEVREAQQIIERQLGDRPETFAYPFGAFNATAVSAVRDAGLLVAFTTQSGTKASWATRLTIPRIHVGPGTSTALLLQAIGAGR